MKTPDNVAKQVLAGTQSRLHPGCTSRGHVAPQAHFRRVAGRRWGRAVMALFNNMERTYIGGRIDPRELFF